MNLGNWLAIEHDTPHKPEMLRIATILGVSHGDAFLAMFKMWVWFDRHTADGIAHGMSAAALELALGVPAGFASAAATAGWLIVTDESVQMPYFDSHTSQSAKARQQKAKRQAKYRVNQEEATPAPRQRHARGAGVATGASRDAPPTDTDTNTERNTRTTYVRTYECLLEEVEELREAKARRVEPQDASALRFDAFAGLTETHLKSDEQMAIWHRCQLSSQAPAIGDTEADLLLVLAAAKAATNLPAGQVKTSRRAFFIWILRHREFERVMRYLPAAMRSRAALGAGLEVAHGDVA